MNGNASCKHYSRIHSASQKLLLGKAERAHPHALAGVPGLPLGASAEPAAANLGGILDPQPDSGPRSLAPAPSPAPEAGAAASPGPASRAWESPSGRPEVPATQPEWQRHWAWSPAPPPN